MKTNTDKTVQIGLVQVHYIGNDQADAPVLSNDLLDSFKSDPDYAEKLDAAGSSGGSHEYHLSPARQNLIKWIPFRPGAVALEVGADCGALTGVLCDKLEHVVALEHDPQQALVAAQRHSRRANLEVAVGKLKDYPSDSAFDYITVVGAHEYARAFCDGPKPLESFLGRLRKMLKPDGELILAFESKIVSGSGSESSEGHIGEILESAGFHEKQWYYPLPDHKMPRVVLSDEAKLSYTDSFLRLLVQQNQNSLQSKTLAETESPDQFADSFMVIAGEKNDPEQPRCLRFRGADQGRRRRYRTNLKVLADGSEKTIVRSADNDESVSFIRDIAEREALAEKFFADRARVVTGRLDGSSLYYPCIEYPSLHESVGEAIENDAADTGRSIVEQYVRFVHDLPSCTCIPERFMSEFDIPTRQIAKPVKCLNCAAIDLVPQNIKVGPDGWYIIDHEWTYDYPLPVDYVIFRGLVTLVVGVQSQIMTSVSQSRPVAVFWGYGRGREYIPMSWVDILRDFSIPLEYIHQWERSLQHKIRTVGGDVRFRLKENPKPLTRIPDPEQMSAFELPIMIRSILAKPAKRLLRFLRLR